LKLQKHDPHSELCGKHKKRNQALRSDIFDLNKTQIKAALSKNPELLIKKIIDVIEALSHDAKTRGR
tara:strand:- start:525 stop:725 length:201 start_codon:yes stop_codon:yes gene_type:complete